MVYLNYIWLILSLGIILGFIVINSERLKLNLVLNLYVFGKLRNLQEFSLTSHFLQVPKRWFWHFYCSGLLIHTALLTVMVYSVFVADKFPEEVSLFLGYIRIPASESELLPPAQILAVLLMGEVQMIRRLTECIFVNSYSASTMSVVIYLTGVFFYCFQGISIVCLMQEKTLTLSAIWSDLQWYNYLLITMFLYFSYKQHILNNILSSLRCNEQGAVVTDKHLIPEGDLFQHSSCPHFFMEILIYSVYCAMFWWRHTVCNSIGLFVLVNQLLAGHLAHRWYQENFPNYPRERTPVIPLVHYSRLAGVPPPKKKKC